MISSRLGGRARRMMLGAGIALARLGLTPNTVTLVGLALNGVVAWVLSNGHFVLGGALMLAAGVFDMLDGAVARAAGKVTRFGGFLDSTLDRYSEALLLLGLLAFFTEAKNESAVLLVYITFVGSVMISYARARAEALGVSGEAGLLARPERVVLLGLLLVFNAPVPALWILAVGTNLTAVQRIWHTYRVLGG